LRNITRLIEPSFPADQRIRRYLPVREKGVLKERVIKEMWENEGVGEGQLRRNS
jgi:hypothetical protein